VLIDEITFKFEPDEEGVSAETLRSYCLIVIRAGDLKSAVREFRHFDDKIGF